jgi:hypothetical protein
MSIETGDELKLADSGEHLRKGTTDCRRMELSLLDSLLCDEIGNEAHLPDHSRDSGMVSVDDAVSNSGEATRSDIKNREIG